MSRILLCLTVTAYCSVWLITDHFLPWVSWHSEAVVFLAVALLAWRECARGWAGQRDRTLKIPAIALSFLAVGIVSAIQALTGTLSFWGDVWVNWLYVGLCVICLVVGFEFGLGNRDIVDAHSAANPLIFLSFVLLFGAILSTTFALAQTFDVWELGSWITGSGAVRRPGANLSQPNHLATFLTMSLASLLYLYQLKRLSAIVATAIVTFLNLGLIVTESRTGALILLLLMLWFLSKRKYLPVKIPLSFLAILYIVFAALFYAWPSIWRRVHIFDGAIETNFTASGRLDIWTQILNAISERPWLGWGLRQVPEAHNSVAHKYTNVLSITYSHNVILDLAVWVGVPLTLAFIWVFSKWLWLRVANTQHLSVWYCIALAIPLAVHSMLEFPYAYAYFLAPVMFVLGVLEGRMGVRPVLRLGMRSTVTLLTVASVAMTWSAVEYFKIEDEFRIARFEALHIGQTPPNHDLWEPVLLTQLGGLVSLIRVMPKAGMTEDQIDLVKRVALHYPWSATLSRYAQVLALNGNAAEAERQFEVIHRMFGQGAAVRARMRLKELRETGDSAQPKFKPM